MRLYRGEAVALIDRRAEWIRQNMEGLGVTQAEGRWWTDELSIAEWYKDDAGAAGIIRVIEVEDPEPYRVSNLPGTEAWAFSRDREREFFLPVELARTGRILED